MIKGRQVIITIFDDSTGKEVTNHIKFKGDELTSPEGQAIEWLKSQEADPLHAAIQKQK